MALWPAAVLSLAFAGVGTASIWCSETPALTLTDEDRARLADLAALLDGDIPHDPAPLDCPDCQIVGSVVLPNLASAPILPSFSTVDDHLPERGADFIHAPRGPPNGSRAPPVFII